LGLFLCLLLLERFLFFFGAGWKTVQEILEVVINFEGLDVFGNVAYQVLDFILNTSELGSLLIFISPGLI
jgi:hypothetical protein